MKKINAIFEGVIFLWIWLIVSMTILSMCLSGMCSPDWLFRDVVITSIAEIILFVWIVVNIQKGSLEVLRETKNFLMVKALCKKVLHLSVVVALYGLVTFCLSSKLFNYYDISENEENAALIYLVNMLGVSSIIFFWMCVKIHKINRKMRF